MRCNHYRRRSGGNRWCGYAANLGYSVAIVDSHAELSGAGVDTGTIASKTLVSWDRLLRRSPQRSSTAVGRR